MPRNKKQEIIYTLMMVIVMVYGMICYNVALNVGGMKNMVFGAALGELPIMGTLAFVVDFFCGRSSGKEICIPDVSAWKR